MLDEESGNRRGLARLVRCLVPLGVVVAATASGARNAPDRSELPAGPPTVSLPPDPGPAPSGPPSALPVRARVQIVSLRAGPAAIPAGRASRALRGAAGIARTFVTESASSLQISAVARIPGHPDWNSRITWEVTPPAGFVLPGGDLPPGPTLAVLLDRPGGNPGGLGSPLAFTVTAFVPDEAGAQPAQVTVEQDLLDRLRQEYVDLNRSVVPGRGEFLDAVAFQRRFGRRYPRVTFEDLNWSRLPGSEVRYPFVLATEALVRTIHETRRLYGPVTVSSGFRNPVRQLVVHGSVGESHHQYGRAADLHVAPDSSPPRTGRAIATELDWFRLASTALRAGGVWIEPMLACHVNTAGCHVHVDVREAGAASAVVRVTGRITDSWGNPIPGAVVRMAGMPAVTNAGGIYHLKHVVTAAQQTLEVMKDGRPLAADEVTLSGGITTVSVQLPPTGSAFAARSVLPTAPRAAAASPQTSVLPNITSAPADPNAAGSAPGLPVPSARLAPQSPAQPAARVPLTPASPQPPSVLPSSPEPSEPSLRLPLTPNSTRPTPTTGAPPQSPTRPGSMSDAAAAAAGLGVGAAAGAVKGILDRRSRVSART